MRTYPRNSPQAAARIVALALTADGHVSSAEERALENLDIAGELGLAPAQFAQIVQALCEDQSLANTPFTPPVGQLDAALLAALIDEIDDPALRRKVIRLCLAVAIADEHLADGEIALLAALFNAWGPKPGPAARRRLSLPPAPCAQARTAASTREAST
jgi:tellurite resistance protein